MSDIEEAQRALQESRQSKRRTEAIAAEASKVFGLVREHRQKNHYAEKARLIMRGAH